MDEPLKPLVIYLFGRDVSRMSRDDVLLAMEFMLARKVTLSIVESGNEPRLRAIAEHLRNLPAEL